MSEDVQRVEVITSVQRRRRWSAAEKIRLVEAAIEPDMSVPFVARKHGISPSLLFRWRQRMVEGGREAVRVDDEVIGAARVRQLEERVRELERLLGRKTLARPAYRAWPASAARWRGRNNHLEQALGRGRVRDPLLER